MTEELIHNKDQNRYEYFVDGKLAAFEEYQQSGQTLAFNHTESLPEFAGQGIAKKLVRAALLDVKSQGQAVIPNCPNVAKFIKENSEEFGELVAQS